MRSCGRVFYLFLLCLVLRQGCIFFILPPPPRGGKTLLAKGADISKRDGDHEYNALDWAAFSGHADVVSLPIEQGADVNGTGWCDDTALLVAVQKDLTDVVSVLLSNGADVNSQELQDGRTALVYAAMNGNIEMVSALLQCAPHFVPISNVFID